MNNEVHPLAWWGWAIALATAASFATNAFVMGLILAVVALVVAARRGFYPWAKAFPLYLGMGLFIILFRSLMHILVGLKTGDPIILPLPAISLPSWAAGINLLGPVGLEGLLAAAREGLRLATIIICFGAANCLANPKQLVKTLPAALGEIGTALVIAISMAPSLAVSVVRVRRARLLRGAESGPLQVIIPVLQDTLDRSLKLASSMDARGYGRRSTAPPAETWMTSMVGLVGLTAATIGVYVALDGATPMTTTIPVLGAGVVLVSIAIWATGRRTKLTSYHKPQWGLVEWGTLAFGVLPAVASLQLPGIVFLLAALPAWFTPQPTIPPRRKRRHTNAQPVVH